MRPVVLGTAGHIDHGKTSLVAALTGIDTDRLPEEKARGITIELGFAYLDVGERRFGIVDVPGHERFVRHMVAGACGIDVVMLVIAADEGVMPQTREHLDICRLLDVKRGLVVLTKADLVDDEWLELVKEEVRGEVVGSFLEEAPIVAFSGPPGGPIVGLDAVKDALVEAAEVDDRPARGACRLPVDRVFTIKGFGTVLTGTLMSGRLAVGDSICLLPSGLEGKVRGLQAHGESVEEVEAGMRTAINLQGVDREQVSRGDVVVQAGTLASTTMLDVSIRYLRHVDHPLRQRARLLLHVGTTTARATVVLLDAASLEPGEEAMAQLRLDRPVVVTPGDHFILRGFAKTENYGRTVGGGEVLANLPSKHRPGDAGALEGLAVYREADSLGRMARLLLEAGSAGLDRAELRQRTGEGDRSLEEQIKGLLSGGHALRFDRDREALVHMEVMRGLEEEARGFLAAFHEDNPRKRGMSKEELKSRLLGVTDARLFHQLLQRLMRSGDVSLEQDLVRVTDFSPRDDAALEQLKKIVLKLFLDEGSTPPRARELSQRLGRDEKAVQNAVAELAEAEELVRIREDIYLAKTVLVDLRQRLIAYLQAHESIDAGAYKELVGGSRKFTIPIAEHFDKERLTMRVGDGRVLRKKPAVVS